VLQRGKMKAREGGERDTRYERERERKRNNTWNLKKLNSNLKIQFNMAKLK
jgi:hypothetical protein